MAIEPWVIAVLLVAAVTHALWNAVVKSSGDRLFAVTSITAVGGLLFVPVLFFVEPPAVESWPFLFASIVIHTGYYVSLVWAYRYGDLSAAYPVARGSAPLLIAIGAAVFAGQVLGPVAAVGVVVTSVGISMFAFEKGLPRGENFKPFVTAFSVSLLIAGYTVVDGMGLRRTPSSIAYIAWLFVLDMLPILFYTVATRGEAFVRHFRLNWRREAAGGVLSAVAYAMVLYVLAFSGMAHVSALRETSVLFAVIIGAIKLKERFGIFRWTAALIVTTGVIVMQFGH